MRSTPGVVFQGHQRPSTVMGKAVENNQVGKIKVILTSWTSILFAVTMYIFEMLLLKISARHC